MKQETRAFPPLEDSASEESITQGGIMRISESLHSFLDDKERSKIFLEQHLEVLKATQQQQLQEIQLQLQAGLESRIQQNSLLAASTDSPLYTNGLKENNNKNRGNIDTFNRPKRSTSTPDLSIKMNQRKSSDPTRAWASSAHVTQSQGSQRQTLLQTKVQSRFEKEEMEWAECQKQFQATPVPEHVHMSLYDDAVREQERTRQEGIQQRKEFLLSMQQPFTFHQREQKKDRIKQEKDTDKLTENSKHAVRRKNIPKAVTDPTISQHLKEEEQKRKIRIQERAQETLRASSAPIQIQVPRVHGQQARTSQRTKSRVLGFLEQRPSFQPKTNAEVPDFNKLHQAFQKKTMEAAVKKEVTRCQPFQLRTSTLQPRQSRADTDQSLSSISKSSLRRSISYGGLTSLSMDTLPTYITDAARKRSMAIRKSMELRDSKEQEHAEWMKQHHMNSQAMSRALVARAKAMDPHKSLKDVYQQKLKQHRQADQERVKDYKKDLKEMKARVTVRPYLFEQVSQKNAKTDAERRYRSTLQQAGLDENFVRSKGENDKSKTARSKGSDTESDGDQHGSESEIQEREGWGNNSIQDEEGTEESEKTKEEEVC
ncbi:protein FAM161B [Astyanax mexicanus]|uniref:Protein FAM161B n=1 Tax=Astyanax mexicanus TaxID=7994 RepID=A0A8T2LF88_ASTMX|nr:protein FAM161B [Astyanax mexicanus]